jgi:Uma2 family endonuclease
MALGSNSARSMKTRATYEDLLAVPDHKVAELLDGELHVSPRPAPPHALAASAVAGELWGPFHTGRGGPGGWWILSEPELHLGEDVAVPDVAGWRRSRLPALPEAAYFDLAPDWICEVVSPSTEGRDRSLKMKTYGREGVGHAWLVNPLARTLEVYRRSSEGWVLLATHVGDVVVRAEPFDAAELRLAAWWPPVGAPET